MSRHITLPKLYLHGRLDAIFMFTQLKKIIEGELHVDHQYVLLASIEKRNHNTNNTRKS